MDHLSARIVRGNQEVKRIWHAKPRLRDDQIRRGCEQRAFARVFQIPKSPLHIDEVERDGRRRRFVIAIQRMTDIAVLAEQAEKLRFVL